MAEQLPKPAGKLADNVGHRFADETVLKNALTHSSFHGVRAHSQMQDFERLEFVGDRVLGLVISTLLYEAFPNSDEGGLATRFNLMVRKETCAQVARDIDLGSYLLMSPGEQDAGGRQKQAILGNACEALIAALYFDGGLDVARQFITKYWEPYLDQVVKPPQDAKTALQEWAQSKGLSTPKYSVVDRQGPDHAPNFTMSVEVEGLDGDQAEGSSKRLAEQAAAERLLMREGIWNDE